MRPCLRTEPFRLLSPAALLAACLLVGCAAGSRPVGEPLNVAAHSSPWGFGKFPGQEIETAHYRIFTTSQNHRLLGAMPGFMEGAYAQYRLLTGLEDPPGQPEPLPLYLLGSRQQWVAMTERVTGPSSPLYLSVETGGYCYRGVCVLWDMGHFATFAIAAHEGCHQFLHSRLRDGLPAWAEEGLCVQAEGFRLGSRTVRFAPELNSLRESDLRRSIVSGRWIPLRELLAGDPSDHLGGTSETAAEYYGQLWALLRLLRSDESLRGGLERMVSEAAEGKLRKSLDVPAAMGSGRSYARDTGVPAFRHYIADDLPTFEKRFLDFAKKLVKL